MKQTFALALIAAFAAAGNPWDNFSYTPRHTRNSHSQGPSHKLRVKSSYGGHGNGYGNSYGHMGMDTYMGGSHSMGGYGGHGGYGGYGHSYGKSYGGYGGYGHDHHDHDEHDHEEPEEPEEEEETHEDSHSHHHNYGHYGRSKYNPYDISKLMDKVTALEGKVDALEVCQLEINYFTTNPMFTSELDTPFVVEPEEFCVTAGQTVDIALQGTLDAQTSELIIGYQVLKNGDVVAEARIADSETPSSVSILYRETLGDMDDDTSFSIQFIASEV